MLLAGFGMLFLFVPYISSELLNFTKWIYEDGLVRFESIEAGEIPVLFIEMLWLVVRLASPVVFAALVVGVASQVAQVGFLTARRAAQAATQTDRSDLGL